MTYNYGLEYNLEKAERYAFQQAGITLAMLLKAYQGDADLMMKNISMQ